MNLILFLLSFLFASYAPTTQTTITNDDDNTGSVNEPGPGKGGKYNDGDYIIWSDVNP